MARDNCQKIKLLKLIELLRQETDEQHPMKTMEIIERLAQMGISCERRTLAKDIALLNEQGVEVMCNWVNREKGYYVEDRSFSVAEQKILIDAVQAASFITEKKSTELIDKIAALAGSHKADVLKDNIVCFNTRKHSNESIYYNVDAIERAIQQQKQVGFHYFDLGINREKIYRRNKQQYVVEPVALVYNEDNYYLVAYSQKHENTTNYRVDRMDGVDVLDEDVGRKALELRDDMGEYTEQAFKMYAGPVQPLLLEFDKKLIGSVYDRFGEGINMLEADNGNVVATVKVQLSPTFWGWIFQFGRQMKVISPDSAVDEYKARAAELLE